MAHFQEPLIRFRVRQVVGDVCEPCTARIELLNKRERLFYRLMHGMWNVAESIQY